MYIVPEIKNIFIYLMLCRVGSYQCIGYDGYVQGTAKENVHLSNTSC